MIDGQFVCLRLYSIRKILSQQLLYANCAVNRWRDLNPQEAAIQPESSQIYMQT